MSNLPEFARRSPEYVQTFMQRALKPAHTAHGSALREIITYDDGHYRAVFSMNYFALHEGAAEPTKSQWNTLKKHLKRIEPRLFIYKQHGTVQHDGETCLYLDFAFFAH
jgi:hypothetical protein